jgi:putative transposase
MARQRSRRKRLRRYHEPGDFHELTFSTYRQLPLLTNDAWRRILSRHIDAAGQSEQIQLVGFVYMPEHLHMLVYPTQIKPRIEAYLARFKQSFSKEIRAVLEEAASPLLDKLMVRERPKRTCFRFWQEGAGYDRNIRSTRALQGSLDYIHNNPARRGLCERAIDWKWSSARYYFLEPPGQQFPDLPYIHGFPLGSFD